MLSSDSLQKANQRLWIGFPDNLLFLHYQVMSAETQEAYGNTRDQLVSELLKITPAEGAPVFNDRALSLVGIAYVPLLTRMYF